MTEEKFSAGVIKLVEIAIDETRSSPAEAIMMLADAAMMIMLTRHTPASAIEMAPVVGEYIKEQINCAAGAGQARQ